MASITVIFHSGRRRRVWRGPDVVWLSDPVTLIVKREVPAAEDWHYDVRLLDESEALSADLGLGIRVGEAREHGGFAIRILDEQERDVEPARDLLDRIVLVPAP